LAGFTLTVAQKTRTELQAAKNGDLIQNNNEKQRKHWLVEKATKATAH
jgi:hypothetical protein